MERLELMRKNTTKPEDFEEWDEFVAYARMKETQDGGQLLVRAPRRARLVNETAGNAGILGMDPGSAAMSSAFHSSNPRSWDRHRRARWNGSWKRS